MSKFEICLIKIDHHTLLPDDKVYIIDSTMQQFDIVMCFIDGDSIGLSIHHSYWRLHDDENRNN